jgi:uncharacterized protein (TIGR02145 family)
MKQKSAFVIAILLGLVIVFNYGCKKKPDEDNGSLFCSKTTAVFNPQLTYGTMTDQDGNCYRTIQIGKQVWMAENLRTSRFRNGVPIPVITDSLAWYACRTSACCTYFNTTDSVHNATYGRLYNWYAVNDSNLLAPPGWHVPSSSEWDTLVAFLGGVEASVNKLKEQGKTHWLSTQAAGNGSGFTALPGGCRAGYCYYYGIEYWGFWWSSTSYDMEPNLAWYRSLSTPPDSISPWVMFKYNGYSVRCVKD